jgi:hypothetical protein
VKKIGCQEEGEGRQEGSEESRQEDRQEKGAKVVRVLSRGSSAPAFVYILPALRGGGGQSPPEGPSELCI